jgi:two-component system cell cycle sensor histidine kinase/response regulator CckA
VIDACGGEAALKAAERERIDLLLTDVVMPGMSGREVAEQLRHVHPSVGVLHMSGHASGLAGAEPGAAPGELIEKPFTSTELLGRVRAVLGRRALSAAS